MRCVCCLLLISLCYTECVCDDDLFPTSTVDLVSVLRRNLVTNNDDFTPRHAPPTADLTRDTEPPHAQHYPKHDNYPSQSTKVDITKAFHQTKPQTTSPNKPTGDKRSGWRRINVDITTTKKPFKKSEYLLPNKLIANENEHSLQFSLRNSKPQLRTIDPKKFTTTRTTTEGVNIFYETITKHHEISTKAVPQLRASTASVAKSSMKKLQVEAFKRQAVLGKTSHIGLVIDDSNLLASYQPFTGKNFRDMKKFMVTKFFDFENRSRDHIARLVPTTWTKSMPLWSVLMKGRSDDELNLHVLDMAPGTGDHVDKGRRKQRICDRNVLYPEGPKYDKMGNEYFVVKKRPKNIVPRCCNCCKKSQLGCE